MIVSGLLHNILLVRLVLIRRIHHALASGHESTARSWQRLLLVGTTDSLLERLLRYLHSYWCTFIMNDGQVSVVVKRAVQVHVLPLIRL